MAAFLPTKTGVMHGALLSPQQSQEQPHSAHLTISAAKPTSDVMQNWHGGQLPTPDPPPIPAGLEWGYGWSDGRGKRLTVEEELCLVRICRREMEGYDVNDYRKSFWQEVSDKLYDECGRSYTWQSCRRRVATYISNHKTYWRALSQGVEPPWNVRQNEVSREVDKWVWEWDAFVKAEQVRDEIAKEKAAAAAREKQRLEDGKRKGESAHCDDQRSSGFQRIRDWIAANPDPVEMPPLPFQWGQPSGLPENVARPRSRSRSPCRDAADDTKRYRQRSPVGSRQVVSPGRVGGVWRDPLRAMCEGPTRLGSLVSPVDNSLPPQRLNLGDSWLESRGLLPKKTSATPCHRSATNRLNQLCEPAVVTTSSNQQQQQQQHQLPQPQQAEESRPAVPPPAPLPMKDVLSGEQVKLATEQFKKTIHHITATHLQARADQKLGPLENYQNAIKVFDSLVGQLQHSMTSVFLSVAESTLDRILESHNVTKDGTARPKN